MTDDQPVPVYETASERQTQRQSLVPALYRTSHERMCCELALDMEDAPAIFTRYGYDAETAADLVEQPGFKDLLQRVSTEIRETGLSFRLKAKAIAEDLLPHAHDMATDPLCSSAVRADLIKWTAKMAGHEPPPNKGEVAGSGGFTLSITFAGQAPQQIVAGREPVTLEHQPEA